MIKGLKSAMGLALALGGCVSYEPMPLDKISIVQYACEENSDNCNSLTWEEAVRDIKTPEQVQRFLQCFAYEDLSKPQSFAFNFLDKKGTCVDYALAAAALLSDDGFPQVTLIMQGKRGRHAVYPYKTSSGWGALGNTNIMPVCNTIEDLVKEFEPQHSLRYNQFDVLDLLGTFHNGEYIDGKENINFSDFPNLPHKAR